MEQFLPALWELARTAGPFGTVLMLLMWWREARARDKLQLQHTDLLERMITANNELAEAVSAVNMLLQLQRPRR